MKRFSIFAALLLASVSQADIFDTGTGLGFTIPDDDVITYDLNVTGLTGTLTRVDFYFSPNHTFIGDLFIDAVTPTTGVTLDFLETPGNAVNNSGGSDRTAVSMFFAQTGADAEKLGTQALNGNVDSATSGIVYAHSNFFSADSYADVTTLNGTWTFEFGDIGANDTGSVDRIVIHTQAVPEPASMAALGLGAAALLRRRRRA